MVVASTSHHQDPIVLVRVGSAKGTGASRNRGLGGRLREVRSGGGSAGVGRPPETTFRLL